MIETLARWRDQLLGRGEAAITIPIFDGALKPNQVLEDAEIVAYMPGAEDLATNGSELFVAHGNRVLRLAPGRLSAENASDVARFERRITALACTGDGGFVAGLEGREVKVSGGAVDGQSWVSAVGRQFLAVNALSVRKDGRILVSDGSAEHPYDRWAYDLMSRGATGRLVEINPAEDTSHQLASGLAYAFGVCEANGVPWVCESWRHRILRIGPSGATDVVLDELPGYPSRISPASDGGFWMTAFAGRTQLVEFVLRESKFRRRMISEVDPRYWIAPALSSGKSFLEPLQGAGVKMRGVLKPWAPPRSYGLIVKLSSDGAVERSFHSRLDGMNHGVVAAVEFKGSLFALSKGSGRILRIPIAEERSVIQ